MNKKGFTLVELLAVIAILAILVIIALPNVLKMFNDSNKAIKMNNETAEPWWTRSAVSDYSKGFGCINANGGGICTNPSTFTLGVSPAFRIG